MIYKKIDNQCSKSIVENSKYLDEKLKDSKKALLLHNVKIHHQGEEITIDHILISRMGIEILKSKSFENQEILIGGDNALIIDNGDYSNPIETVEKEKIILENFLKKNLPFSSNSFWFMEKKIGIEATVIFSTDSHIVNEKLPNGFDRVEDYLSHREEKIAKVSSGVAAFKVLANMLSAKSIKDIASLLSGEQNKALYSNEDIEAEELIAS
ncbi:MAG: NERD domain-containing protein [Sulfurovaceae bacterium]|nr:NERD domain-containing protein [Sulfurovaceae bacterium]